MSPITNKIQLIFCAHNSGHLAYEKEIQAQPPLGLLILAGFIKQEIPEIEVEVIDGKLLIEDEILTRLDSDFIGLSIWFSNYNNSLSLIGKIKKVRQNSKIILGGPHTSYLGRRIIKNNPDVDYIIIGEGEVALASLLKGNSPDKIPGILFRNGKEIKGISNNKALFQQIDINSIPPPDLKVLYPTYLWQSSPESHAMAAFPISGIRGCNRKVRCEYCSIPLSGYRIMNPEKYWNKISYLNQEYSIDFFFETGDFFSPLFLKELAELNHNLKVAFRIYSYPGILKSRDLPFLKIVGVNTIFMGVESSLIWEKYFLRKYGKNYSLNSLIDEIEMLGQNDIKVIPSFVLGMHGEDNESLTKNVDLILQLSKLNNVNEITVSAVLPIPGSLYFEWCIKDENILNQYNKITNQDLLKTDKIDIYVLSQLFVNKYTKIGYPWLYRTLVELRHKLDPGMANWGSLPPFNQK